MPGEIVVLAGGVGAARFLSGLVEVHPAKKITIIGNTADDAEIHGLHISPDLDTVTYTLAGIADPGQGWGVAGDTFHCLDSLGRFSEDTWFQLGDRDLATHIYRTSLLRAGVPLSEVTVRIARAFGVESTILPMTNDEVRTWVTTEEGLLEFQTYFVKRGAQDQVRRVEFAGAKHAEPAPQVVERIKKAKAVIVAPSNPIISIGPILAVPGIREALRETSAPVLAIAPIVGGRALKGPTARMMTSLGMEASASMVAQLYRDLLDVYVLDEQDRDAAPQVEFFGIRPVVADTIMADGVRKRALARVALEAVS